MTYRRRAGRRYRARRKVTREELVKFYQTATRKERMARARQRAERLAWWLKTACTLAAVAGAAYLVLRELT